MTSANTIRIGTRGSRLALAQTALVAEELRQLHAEDLKVETIIIQTTGDKILDSSLSRIGGKGVFTREIEQALMDGRIDVAVHSLKDLPTVQPVGLALGAVTKREPPHDLLISREPLDWKSLTESDKLGTSSLRRHAQLRMRNKDVEIADLRGNVPTRIRKMAEGEYTAIILAAAGVRRLGLDVPYAQAIPFEEMLPAPGQGSIGLQVREDDELARELLSSLHHEPSAACCGAERALLQGLGGGCQLPLGTLAEVGEDGLLRLVGRVISLDGSQSIEDATEGAYEKAEELGRELAERLLELGAGKILGDLIARLPDEGFEEAVQRAQAMNSLPLGGKTVLLTRDEDADGPLSVALRAQGANPLCLPLVKHMPPEDGRDLADRVRHIKEYDWIVLTSARAVDSLADEIEGQGSDFSSVERPIACVGKGTARRLEERGGEASCVPDEASAAGLIESFKKMGGLYGRRVLYPRADKAKPALADGLKELGALLHEVIAYRTVTTKGAAAVVNELHQGRVQAVLFTSASAAEALADAFEPDELKVFETAVVGAMGPTTATALRSAGIEPDFEPDERTFEGFVSALVKTMEASVAKG